MGKHVSHMVTLKKIFDTKQMFEQYVRKQKYVYTFSHVKEDEYFLVLCCGTSVIFCEEKKKKMESENGFRVEKKRVQRTILFFFIKIKLT